MNARWYKLTDWSDEGAIVITVGKVIRPAAGYVPPIIALERV